MSELDELRIVARQVPHLTATLAELTSQVDLALERVRAVNVHTGHLASIDGALCAHETRLDEIVAHMVLGTVPTQQAGVQAHLSRLAQRGE